jgi:hypothetical protein
VEAAEYALSRAKEAEKTTEVAIQTGREEVRRLREEYDSAMSEVTAMSKERDGWRRQHDTVVGELERERAVGGPHTYLPLTQPTVSC